MDFSGGDRRDRTADLLIANQTLSQLSYAPEAQRIVLGEAYSVKSNKAIAWTSRQSDVLEGGLEVSPFLRVAVDGHCKQAFKGGRFLTVQTTALAFIG